ncbi:MAG: cohesin domain-containing protein [bacterium]|nr:cohesin domain-containing protein [bacterium]
MKNKNIILKILILLVVVSPFKTEASRLYFEPASISAGVGSVVKVQVLLDSSSEKINALEVAVKYPSGVLRLKDWNDGNSIINLWIQAPKTEKGAVIFQGVIPGGYQGAKGLLLTLNFEVISRGSGTVTFEKTTQALLNDGRGTSAALKFDELSIDTAGDLKTNSSNIEDETAPEDFLPIISRDPNLLDNKHFLVFATQDKGSGVDHYEVSEDRGIFKPKPDNWIVAGSPFVLRDQDLKSWIFVMAVDKNGNEKIAFLSPSNIPFYQQSIFVVITCIILFFLLLLSIARYYGKKIF